MQLSARILTALAVLAFVVGVVVGTRGATDEVSAATGTIDALNVGACATNNADVFVLANCTQKMARFQQEELKDLIEVDTLYATYAHDPKTGAENPRAILGDSDLIRVSISDKGRDRRDPVLITSANPEFNGTGLGTTDSPFLNADGDPFGAPAAPDDPATTTVDEQVVYTLLETSADDDATTRDVDESVKPRAIVAESAIGDAEKTMDLPPLEQVVQFGADGVAPTGITDDEGTTFGSSGSYQVLFEDGDLTATPPVHYKPIAPDGTVKFFGRVSDNGDTTIDPDEKFQDIGTWIKIDEDVISGDTNVAPAIKLNVSVPNGGAVQLQLIYYETSGVEYIQGGFKCVDEPEADPTDLVSFAQAECTAKEREPAGEEDNASFELYAESDEDAGGDGTDRSHRKNLALIETGRFTGVFQGFLRLTDADGIGGTNRDNWGLMKKSGALVGDLAEGIDLADGIDADELAAAQAVLGVGNGPITIRYKDSDDKNKSFDIQLDIEPPSIQIDSPMHNDRSDDEKPSFIGTFNDADSGLAAESFQLNIDNRDIQEPESAVMRIMSDVKGTGDDMDGQVLRRLDYQGFSDEMKQFGVIEGDNLTMEIYKIDLEIELEPGQSAAFKAVEADDFDDGDPDGAFNEEQEIDFDEVTGVAADFVFNHAIDFQAAVRDLAGNIGFSDSDAANPRFIDALGEEKAAKRTSEGKKHNVLGYFSAHIVHIDDLDPKIAKEMSVTGFYGLNSDDEPVRDRSAVMVVFDGGVNGDLIDTGTFTLEYDDESAIAIEDVVVDGKLVFLKLGEKLASDARPTLSISEGREVEDMAGNVLSWQEKDAEAFKLADGILPVLTLTLSGGSGTGIGREGPSELTDGAIDIAIASDEDLTGAPSVSVVCPNVTWKDGDDKERGLSDFVNNRTGYTDASTGEMDLGLLCGEAAEPNSFIRSASLARPGNNWVYAWRNSNTKTLKLNDGELVIVVWARDRSDYDGHNDEICDGSKCENFGSVTTRFVLDNTFNSPLKLDGSGGSVQPAADSEVKEPRPFVYLDFAGEPTTVKVTEFTIDGEDALSSLSTVGDNRFLYWPESLAFGTHTIEFDARDAADNEPIGNTSFDFDVTARDPFVIDLTAGWNAISLPANPVDTALDAVFTEEAVDRVVGWNPLSSTGPWSIATRMDGVWSTSANFAPLTDVVVRYGYWVHSMAFVKQSVDLKGQLDRETGDNPAPIGIITAPGWNFVGVIDQDGDQTENHFGKVLQDSEKTDVTADDYMPGFRQAYTWDAIANGYRVLNGDGNMIIGKGIWVFFPDDETIAP
ncbi:MAG: hypothetical protein OXC83_01950 [Chloroflexi bacterium]|nr:hypothetical protein [Chloroflexota bacterium]